jgi:pSer/pThr/pTyr-binding forkhead associated (FHA) protein
MVLTTGKSAGQVIPVTLSQFVIGRDPQCNLRPASAVISKRHCALLIRNGKVFVRDFDSTNGTFVNDEQVKGERPLNHEDTLKIGPLAFRVVIEASVPVNKPTPVPPKAGGADDESVAAMLLSLQDDGGAAPEGDSTTDSGEIPGGSTVMELMPVPAGATSPAEPKEEEEKKQDVEQKKPPEKPAAKPSEKANTSLAAKAILEKYTRRQR